MPTRQQAQPAKTNATLIASVSAILSSGILPSMAYTPLSALLVGRKARSNSADLVKDSESLRAALSVLDRFPPPRMEALGAAQAAVLRENELRRAAYLIASVDRFRTSLDAASAHGWTPAPAIARATAVDAVVQSAFPRWCTTGSSC